MLFIPIWKLFSHFICKETDFLKNQLPHHFFTARVISELAIRSSNFKPLMTCFFQLRWNPQMFFVYKQFNMRSCLGLENSLYMYFVYLSTDTIFSSLKWYQPTTDTMSNIIGKVSFCSSNTSTILIWFSFISPHLDSTLIRNSIYSCYGDLNM